MAFQNKLKESLENWKSKDVQNTINRYPEREEQFLSLSDMPVKRLYTPLDWNQEQYFNDLGFPGCGRGPGYRSDGKYR